MTHLTVDTWRKLQEGALAGPEKAALVAHLYEDCDDCDAVVAVLDDLALDCAVDAALAALPGEPPADGGLVFHRLEQRILNRSLRPHRRRAWVLAGTIALAASAILVLAVPMGDQSPGQRTKGSVRLPTLTAMIALHPGAPLEALDSGRTYPSTAELYFTYDLPEDAHLYLGRVGVDGVVEPFYPPLGAADPVVGAGVRPLTIAGTIHAYSLEGLHGQQRFILLSSPIPLEGAALIAALKSASPQSSSLQIEVAGW